MDTIDLSNLNRQFLFRQKHVSKSKARIAAKAASAINPLAKITPYHTNIITDARFDVDWFRSFDLVMNALDNLEARKHVNRMCLASNTPLIESGTAGLLGQASVHIKRITECFECTPKATRKVYPVCTIRNTPSQPIHCIVWSKDFLFSKLFGEDDDASVFDESDGKLEELEKLKLEEAELKRLKLESNGTIYAHAIFNKVFGSDVESLLNIDGMWEGRVKPVPLRVEQITQQVGESSKYLGIDVDHQVWSLHTCYEKYKSSCEKLRKRETPVEFDKDDDTIMDFVTACSNIRSHIFGIPLKTRFEVKEMAGNIIPAIATTNAIISGLIVLMARKVLNGETSSISTTFLSYHSPKKILHTEKLQRPNPHCKVCSMAYRTLKLDMESVRLGDVVKICKRDFSMQGDISVIDERARLLYDFDFEDNESRTLADLKLTHSSTLTISEDLETEEEQWAPVNLILLHEPGSKNVDLIKTVGDDRQKMTSKDKSDNISTKNTEKDKDSELKTKKRKLDSTVDLTNDDSSSIKTGEAIEIL